MYLQDGNLHTIQEKIKEEMLSLKGNLGITGIEWGPENRYFREITRNINRSGDSGFMRDNDKKI